jgi:hypothetical protein
MHKLRDAAGRRTVGMAAGLILIGGLAGGVLLTPGTAYAAESPTITITNATPSFGGISVQVSVTGGTTPLGTFSVSGAGNGCTGTLFGAPGSGNGNGHCTIPSVTPGTYPLTAAYGSVSSSPDTVTVTGPSAPTPPPTPTPTPSGDPPAFTVASPPTSVDGQSYSADFQASGSPSYELFGAPSWLSIGPDGTVYGTIPAGTTFFSYSVRAWNNWGWAIRGPFNVFFRNNYFRYEHVNLSTSLSCTSPVHNGQRGTCTLWVTNTGGGFAPDVNAQIALPWQLRADYCGYYQFWNWSSNQYWNNWWNNGCSIYGNTAYESLGSLYPWQTKQLTVTFTALSGYHIWGRHPGWNDTVRVVGSASSGFNNFFGNFFWDYQFWGQRESFSVAWVTIIPRGFWW